LTAAPRIFSRVPLAVGNMQLPEATARHVQVLRLQPGDTITLFDGTGGEWLATITDMKKRVAVELSEHRAVEREASRAVTLAVGVPANQNMDWLVEKATELGAAAVQPLITERSVLRLSGERADKKRQHWQAIAQAASEQCGRNRVPSIAPLLPLEPWIKGLVMNQGVYVVLSTIDVRICVDSLNSINDTNTAITLLSGPEGGLSTAEVHAAQARGFVPTSLGPRILRAETAPLAALAKLLKD
jgi:16S rRNA (uracil1498-N3)-methyltransferase